MDNSSSTALPERWVIVNCAADKHPGWPSTPPSTASFVFARLTCVRMKFLSFETVPIPALCHCKTVRQRKSTLVKMWERFRTPPNNTGHIAFLEVTTANSRADAARIDNRGKKVVPERVWSDKTLQAD